MQTMLTTINPQTFCRKIPPFSNAEEVLPKRFWIDRQAGTLYACPPAITLSFPMLAIRHGQTDDNVRHAWQGQIDGPSNQLNAVGKEQARIAAENLFAQLSESFGAALPTLAMSGKFVVLSSPLGRAKETAQTFLDYLAGQTGITLPLRIEPDLAEIFFGVVEGGSLETLTGELLECLLQFKYGRDATMNWLGTGESFTDVTLRAYRLLERLNAEFHAGETLVAAFSHGTLINGMRVAVGDSMLIDEQGKVTFRKHMVDNGEAYWFGQSQQLAARLASRVEAQTLVSVN
ncbi:phosphoglycerate mutase [Candidatus Moduliflexus flocculans]|uniref:Phosphoglycerate mutase n=1 Tax=Candidatus Moduliflexus flocculans TaxID=1499966 RepID=A0A0S6VQ62_9BACT|nr:phosphoglycerate mutase [Candidatus Moduliflexus flocculans]